MLYFICGALIFATGMLFGVAVVQSATNRILNHGRDDNGA